MFWFPLQSKDHKEHRDYLQILQCKKIWPQSKIWIFIYDCNYLSFSCWSGHVSFVSWENVFCLEWDFLLIWNTHLKLKRQLKCCVVYSRHKEIPEQLVWVSRSQYLALRICFPPWNNILKTYCCHVSLCWLNAATQLCCCAWWLKTDKKETSQHDGILFQSQLCFAPIPTLNPGPEIVILLLTFMCVNSIALPLQMMAKPILRHSTYLTCWQGDISSLEPDLRSCSQQIIMRVSSPSTPFLESYLQAALQRPQLDVTCQVTDGEDARSYWNISRDSGPRWQLEWGCTCIWLFLGEEATGMIVWDLGCVGFSYHSRDTQKSLQGWEVSEEKKLCPSKWHPLSVGVWTTVFFFSLDKHLTWLIVSCVSGGVRNIWALNIIEDGSLAVFCREGLCPAHWNISCSINFFFHSGRSRGW